jgi:hypothetical protein
MRGAADWLADDARAVRTFWMTAAFIVVGAIVSVAFFRRQHLVSEAIAVLTVGLVIAVTICRALAVKAVWLGALGVLLNVVALVPHPTPVALINFLIGPSGSAVLWFLVFYRHAPGPRTDLDAPAATVDATVPDSPQPAPPPRPLPGDPDFTYPSPPR